jgi:hypothetical protein
MEDDVLAIDRTIRAEGERLLNRTGLAKILQEYASFSVTGSYTLELMVWRDLDIAMNAPKISIADFFDLGKRITALLSPWKMFFTNNRDNNAGRYPVGLYWGIRLGDIKKGAWKLDLWAFSTEEYRQKVEECQNLKARLNDGNRLTILTVKAQIWNHPQYRDTMTSQDIYDAVLDHGVTSLDGFWEYMKSK